MVLKKFLNYIDIAIDLDKEDYNRKLYINLALGELFNEIINLRIDYKNSVESMLLSIQHKVLETNHEKNVLDELLELIRSNVYILELSDYNYILHTSKNLNILSKIIYLFEIIRYKIMDENKLVINFDISLDYYLSNYFDMNRTLYYKIIDNMISDKCTTYMKGLEPNTNRPLEDTIKHNNKLFDIGKGFRFYCPLNGGVYTIEGLINMHGLEECEKIFTSIKFLYSLCLDMPKESKVCDGKDKNCVEKLSNVNQGVSILLKDSREETPQYILDAIKNKNQDVDIDGHKIVKPHISNCVWIYDKLDASENVYHFMIPNLCFIHDFNIEKGKFDELQEKIYTNDILYFKYINSFESYIKRFNNLLYSGTFMSEIFNSVNECENDILGYNKFISSHIFMGDRLNIIRPHGNGMRFDICIPLETIVVAHRNKNIFADFYLGRCGNVFFRLRNFEHKNQ